MHVAPRHALKKAVLGKNADVLGKIGMVDAARLQVEHLGREQCGQSNRPRGADDDLTEFLPLYVVQHLKDRRETQFLQFVLRQFKFADGWEVFDWDVANLKVAVGSYDGQLFPCRSTRGGHFPDSSGHAINVVERIGEPGAFAILQGDRNCAGQFLKNRSQPFSRGRLTVKTVYVRRENYEDW